MKLAVPELISNSYFPAVVAVELGFDEAKAASCGATRPSDSPFGCQRVGCDRISLRRASLTRKNALNRPGIRANIGL